MSKRWMGSMLSLLALGLMFGGPVHAQTGAPKKTTTTAAKKAPAAHEMSGTGTVTSVDATHLMITHKVAGKDTPMTLMLTPTTKQSGTVETGSKVSVRYHMENSDMVATSVRGQATTAKVKTTTGTKAKKS